MKKSILIHAIWFLVAGGTYLLGSRFHAKPASAPVASTVVVSGAQEIAPLSGSKASAEKTAATKSGKVTEDWLNGFRDADGKISVKGMTQAVQMALKETDPVKSTLQFAALMEELTTENAPAALKSLRESGGGGMQSMQLMSLLGYTWGQKDGKAAMKALDELGGREGGMTKGTAMAGWASANPDEAIKYVAEAKAAREAEQAKNGTQNQGGRNGGGGGRGGDMGLERGLVSGLAKNDPDAALKYVMGLGERERGQYSGVIAQEKLKEGVDSAAKWAMSLDDKSMKRDALETVSGQYRRQDLAAAAEWAANIASDPEARNAVGQIADDLAQKNVGDAIAWASKLPAGESQNEAYEEVFSDWTRDDPMAASTALSKMPNGASKDSAIQSFAESYARENPQDALTWAGTIGNAESRLQTQVDVARNWYRQDQAAALAWSQANLPAQAQTQVTQQRGGPGGGFGGGGGGFGGGGGGRRGR